MDEELELSITEDFEKALKAFKNSLTTVRTARVNATALDNIMVDYYGEPTPINQIATIQVPEPMQLVIKPYSKDDVKNIVAALNASNLGINPLNEGNLIRLVFPSLTTERRKEISKTAKKYTEEAKVTIRNIRRDYNEEVKKDKSISEDVSKSTIEEIQKLTDEYIAKIDQLYIEKDKEIFTI